MSIDTATPHGNEALARLEATASSGPLAHLPIWADVAAADVVPGVSALLELTQNQFDEIEASVEPTWAALMEPLELVGHRLSTVVGTINHLISVKYSDELKQAYDEVQPAVIALGNVMSQSRPVYDAMVALRESDEAAGFSVAQARILDQSIRGMERSGVALDGADQDRYKQISERLGELSTLFSTNLINEEKAARIKVTDEARLDGIPASIIEMAKTQAVDDGAEGAWHFLVNGVSYMAICQQCTDRSLREEMARAFRTRGVASDLDNRPVLREILELRQELAQLVGFDTYADMSVDAKMAPSTQAVWDLIGQLQTAATPVAQSELEALKSFMAEQGAEGADSPEGWDITFWSERHVQL